MCVFLSGAQPTHYLLICLPSGMEKLVAWKIAHHSTNQVVLSPRQFEKNKTVNPNLCVKNNENI